LGGDDEIVPSGGKWEDEEERRFFEDVQDLKDFVPASVLGVEGSYEAGEDDAKELEQERLDREREEVRKLEEELERLGGKDEDSSVKPKLEDQEDDELVSSFYPFIYFIDDCLVCRRPLWAHRKHLHPHSLLT
jgi:regulator of nonsense transcripts 2